MRLLHTLLLFVCGLSASAQITVTNAVFPEVGDTLAIDIDLTVDEALITAPGGDQIWDFSNLSADVNTTQFVLDPVASGNDTLFTSADLVIQSEVAQTLTFYRTSATRLEQIGVIGPDPLGFGLQFSTTVNPAEVELEVPLMFFDQSLTSSDINVQFAGDLIPDTLLQQLPIQVSFDSVRVRVHTDRVDLVDAWGALTTPAGTFDVLRQKRVATTEVVVEVQIPIIGWFDVTDLLPVPGLGESENTSYHFYDNEGPEPVAVVLMDSTSTTSVNRVEYRRGTTTNVGSTAGLMTLSVAPNPAPGRTTVRASLPQPGYQLRVTDGLGRQVYRRGPVQSATVNETLELPRGTYYIGVYGVEGRLLGRSVLLVE